MPQKVMVLDTSVVCCWLDVPGKETAGSREDVWNADRVNVLLDNSIAEGATLVLPLATLIEAGNHISQAPRSRFEIAVRLMDCLRMSLNSESPWVAFVDQVELWGNENLGRIAEDWPAHAASKHSIGDATIKRVADYYSLAGFDVEIVTADAALGAYSPAKPSAKPRRRG